MTMAKIIEIYKEEIPVVHKDGTVTWKKGWYATDGISTYYGDTKAEAAAHFGVPVGFDD
jgi:hypothetical protein